ncbi:MAG: ABC transporter ATP-binding protein [Halococcoides sp.]
MVLPGQGTCSDWLQRPDWLTGRRVLWLAVLLNVELAIVAGWELLAGSVLTDPLAALLPWLWIDLAIVAVAWGRSLRDRRRLAIGVGTGYLAVLAVFGGLVAPGGSGGLALHWLAPGYGPALIYTGDPLTIRFLPYRAIGYAALAILVARRIADASVSALSGVLGLLTCVSCSWSLVAALLAGIGGSTVGLATIAGTPWIGTASYVVAIGVLSWRPTIGG